MKARIFQPSKTAMQSGRGKIDYWVLQLERWASQGPEPLMGWTSAGDTAAQVRLKFDTLPEAEAYARAKGYEYTISMPQARRVKPRNYGDNFRYVPPRKTENT
jgi:hypothetical protein